MINIITKVIDEGPEPYMFRNVAYGTVFTVRESSDIFVKTDPFVTYGESTNVNAVCIKNGKGVWFPDDRAITPYEELVCRRRER